MKVSDALMHLHRALQEADVSPKVTVLLNEHGDAFTLGRIIETELAYASLYMTEPSSSQIKYMGIELKDPE